MISVTISYTLSALKLTFDFIKSCAVALILVWGNLKLQSYDVGGRNKEMALVPHGSAHLHSSPSLCHSTLLWSRGARNSTVEQLYKSYHVSRVNFKQGLYFPIWILRLYNKTCTKKHSYNEKQAFCYKLDLIKHLILTYRRVDTCLSVSSIRINFVPNFSSASERPIYSLVY